MQITDTAQQLDGLLGSNLEKEITDWFTGKLQAIIADRSAKDLYLTYTLIGNKVPAGELANIVAGESQLLAYLQTHQVTRLELARIYLLCKVLEADRAFFAPKVAQLIQLADTGELRTFLRYLVVLPQAEDYRQTAVEALRTNIATIFDAISLENPYPGIHFNDQQWNQMYLKAAFMQRDLGKIMDVDLRANADLARIISDYAHERWAASREVDPLFWRPVAGFLDGVLLNDMKRLLEQGSQEEKHAAALCCLQSGNKAALALLNGREALREKVKNGVITWNNL